MNCNAPGMRGLQHLQETPIVEYGRVHSAENGIEVH